MIKLYHLAEILAIFQINIPDNYLFPLGKFTKYKYREKFNKSPLIEDFGEFKACAYTESDFYFIKDCYNSFMDQIKEINQE